MSLKLRELLIRVQTTEGMFGTRIHFEKTLCVFRAPNTSGKSTCFQAIVYALGLEGMFKSGNDVPLPKAVTDVLEYDGRSIRVLESNVYLELENGAGEVLTIQRTVRGERDRNLISTWRGSMLTGAVAAGVAKEDFFVKLPGAAARVAGFHHMLARFVGWELPEVSKYSGGEIPLYLECIAPLFMVEQKKGWSILPARIPQYFGIRDVAKRSVEFVLNLDAYRNALKRQEARERATAIRDRWKERFEEAGRIAASVNGIVDNLARQPIASWPPVETPGIRVSRQDWMSLRDAIRSDWELLTQLETQDIPKVAEVASQLEQELRSKEDELAKKDFVFREVFRDLQTEKGQKQQAESRVAALNEDLRRYQDIRTLLRLGSDTVSDIGHGSCPTCHQSIVDSLLPQEGAHAPMSTEENIAFIKAQRGIFSAMVSESDRLIKAKETEAAGLRTSTDNLRADIRAIRQTLVSDGREPSRAALEERVRLGHQVRRLEEMQQAFEELMLRFAELAIEWRDVQGELANLPAGDLSTGDETKLLRVETLMQQQLKQYGLSSIAPDAISISRDSYKPIYEGFDLEVNYGAVDLEFNNSASDMIRTHWAYTIALLEVAREKDTNHPGLLLLDEPRQQSTHRSSFAELLKRASRAGAQGQQIIIATSEDQEIIEPMLEGLEHLYINFTDKLLTPMNDKLKTS